jgi:hypothetical protein
LDEVAFFIDFEIVDFDDDITDFNQTCEKKEEESEGSGMNVRSPVRQTQ